MSIEAMKQWLEALEINLVFWRNVMPFKGQEDLASDCIAMTEETITSLRQAIAEAEKQEPVGQLLEDVFGRGQVMWFNKPNDESMLYTHPQLKAEKQEPAIDTTPSQPAIDTTPQPKQEQDKPVAVVTGVYGGRFTYAPIKASVILPVGMALYTLPQHREWVDLNGEELETLLRENRTLTLGAIWAVADKLKEKNT